MSTVAERPQEDSRSSATVNEASPATGTSDVSTHRDVADAPRTRSALRRLGPFFKPYTGLIFNAVSCLLLLSATRLALPLPMKVLVDSVFPARDVTLLWVVGGFLLLVVLFRQLFNFLSNYAVRYVGQRVVFDLRLKLFRHLQRLSMSFYDERSTGKILSRLTSDVAAFRQLMTNQAFGLVTNAFMLAAVLAIMFAVCWKLALAALALFPLHIITHFTHFAFQGRVRSASRECRQKQAEITGHATEKLSGAKIVKSFAAEGRENLAFAQETREAFGLNLHMGMLSLQWNTAASLCQFLGKLLVLVFGGSLVINGELKPGTFIACYAYTNMLHQPVMELIKVVTQLVPALTGVERVFEVLDTQPDVEEMPDPVVLDRTEGRVEFRGVGFAYPHGEPVLHDLTFSAEPGEIVALAGPSGSGKSTVSNLIARFYDCTEGQVLVDGIDIRRLQLRSLRDQIGIVFQDPFLFSGTIEENIRYGKPDATRQEIIEAAKQANAHDFVSELPDGYEAEAGENGTKLSGGQRQRIAIARAILRDPRILILDEASSALDATEELEVQRALDRLMKGRTTFIIAHRLSTIQGADKILVLKNGRIEQVGRHDELVAQPGLYRQLYKPHAAHKERTQNRRVA